MFKNFLTKRITTFALALAMIFGVMSPSTVAFASETDSNTPTEMVFQENSARSGAIVDSTSVAHAPKTGILSLVATGGKRIRTIKIIGNKDGGGAHTTMKITGIYPGIQTIASVDGNWWTIYESNNGVEGSISIRYELPEGGVYNLAMIGYD